MRLISLYLFSPTRSTPAIIFLPSLPFLSLSPSTLLYCPLDHLDAAERASLAASLASRFAWRQSSDEEVKTSLSASRFRSCSS